ncbi:1269_t:CDS:2, partial [Racocetra persica]
TCESIRFSEEFTLNGGNYKTCNKCRFTRTEKKNESVSSSSIENNSIKIISIQEVSQYIMNLIDDLEDCVKLSLVFHIRLDETIISDTDINIKAMVKLIIDKIKDRDAGGSLDHQITRSSDH